MCLLICVFLGGNCRGRGERCDGVLTGWFAAWYVSCVQLTVSKQPFLSWAGQRGRARVKITPKPITSRKKYKTPPSLLLCLPIVFHAQSLSILVITGRHNGTPFLHCSEGGSSSGGENVSRVRRGRREGGRRKERVGWVVPCLAVVSGLWAFELCQISTKVIALIIFYIIEIQHPTYILNFKLDGL